MPDTASTTANLRKLPPRCFARLPSTGEVIAIVRGEPGYHPVPTSRTPEQLNAELPEPPSPEQVEAMLAGSMFGWDVPAADPDVVRASRIRPPPGEQDSLASLLLPGRLTAARTQAGIVLRDGAGEEIATLPPDYTAHDVAVWVAGYVAGAAWGYGQGRREALSLSLHHHGSAARGQAATTRPLQAASEDHAGDPAVADWGGPDTPFRLEGCTPIRPGASPALDRLWTRAGGHLGLYGWLRVADRRAKADGLRGLCGLPARDWQRLYHDRVPPTEAADTALGEHAAEHCVAPRPTPPLGRAHPAT